MSRFCFETDEPRLFVAVGWDEPLRTFFCQVSLEEDCDAHDLLLWKGTKPREIGDVVALAKCLADFGIELPIEIVSALVHGVS